MRMLYLMDSLVRWVDDGRLPRLPSRAEILEGLDRVHNHEADSLHPIAEAISAILSGLQ